MAVVEGLRQANKAPAESCCPSIQSSHEIQDHLAAMNVEHVICLRCCRHNKPGKTMGHTLACMAGSKMRAA